MTEGEATMPTRRADVQFRDEDREVLVVAPQQTAYALNPMARAIWELCDGMTTIEEMTDAICQVFDVDRPTAVTDVRSVIDGLTSAGLVYWGAPDA